jgi:hypothetical protein
MQGFLLFAASVAVLAGLGALVEAVRPRRGGRGSKTAGKTMEKLGIYHSLRVTLFLISSLLLIVHLVMGNST